jgi:hypothetical protein
VTQRRNFGPCNSAVGILITVIGSTETLMRQCWGGGEIVVGTCRKHRNPLRDLEVIINMIHTAHVFPDRVTARTATSCGFHLCVCVYRKMKSFLGVIKLHVIVPHCCIAMIDQASELHGPSDRRLSAKLVPTFCG